MALKHQWKLQESGQPLLDEIASRSLTSIQGTPDFQEAGPTAALPFSIGFDASLESISTTTALGGSWDSQTAMIWFKPRVGSSGVHTLCGSYASGSSSNSWYIRHRGDLGGKWEAVMGTAGSSAFEVLTSDGVLTEGVWYNLAHRWNHLTDTHELVQDGVVIASTITVASGTITGSIDQGGGRMYIGRAPISSSFHANGFLADCQIHDAFLSDAEITTAMGIGGGGGAGPGVSSFLRRNQPRVFNRPFGSRSHPPR